MDAMLQDFPTGQNRKKGKRLFGGMTEIIAVVFSGVKNGLLKNQS